MNEILKREHFSTSRTLDFFSRKELIAQTGHQVAEWPLVILKELVDNSLDAAEEAGIQPKIKIAVSADSITVEDNGPGIPASVIEKVLDFTIRVSSREAYISPCRGAQGNALKTIVAMPFALFGVGTVIIESLGIRHEITLSVDQIRQEPKVDHRQTKCKTKGTKVTVELKEKPSLNGFPNDRSLQNEESRWDEKPSFILSRAKSRFLQFAENFTWLNRHLTLSLKWGADQWSVKASDPTWNKWTPSNPTDPHWYTEVDLSRLIAAHVCHAGEKTVREFVSEFRGLSGTSKQKKVIDAVGLSRSRLSELVIDGVIDTDLVAKLLGAMKSETKPVKPLALGVIGEKHLASRCKLAGGDPDSFSYKKVKGEDDNGIPWVIETCFAYCPKEDRPRRIITGVNWSPGIINPFRQLGIRGESLDSILEQQMAGRDEPTILVLHITCPKVVYSDRGKSSIIVES